jgi:hypothetical protein
LSFVAAKPAVAWQDLMLSSEARAAAYQKNLDCSDTRKKAKSGFGYVSGIMLNVLDGTREF